MKLSVHTDLALRVLMYLASAPADQISATQVLADQFKVSGHHLQKVVQTLRKLALVETLQGKGGGIRLRHGADAIRLGDLVRSLESTGELVDCKNGPCLLWPGCLLKHALDDAEQHFFDRLNQKTLSDMIKPPVRQRLSILRRA